MRSLVILLVASAVPLSLLFSPTRVGPERSSWPGPDRDSVAAILTDRIAKRQAVGFVVGWSRNGKPQYVAAGRRGGPDSPAPDSATVFEIGSVSKVLTTTLLADMVLRKDVSLDDPVRKFLPANVRVPARNGTEIRLVDLATVTSGLPSVPPNLEPKNIDDPYAGVGSEELYQFLGSYELTRDPGSQYEYSNFGMGLLGHALALAVGNSYEDLVIDRVLWPAGLEDTRIKLTLDQQRRFATGHDGGLDSTAHWVFDVIAPAGGWRSTAVDQVRFLQALVSAPAGPLGEAVSLAIGSRRPTGVPNLSVGLGWHIIAAGQTQIVWHNGQTGGFHTFLGFVPSTGANIVILSNAATDIDDIGLHLLHPSIPLRTIPAPRLSIQVAESVLEGYVGRYRLAPGFEIDVTRRGPRLYVQATNQPRFRVDAASPTRFFLTALDAEIEFGVDATGRVLSLTLHQSGRSTPGPRVE